MDDLAAMLHPWTCWHDGGERHSPASSMTAVCELAATALAPRLTPPEGYSVDGRAFATEQTLREAARAYLDNDGSNGTYHAGRMIEARNLLRAALDSDDRTPSPERVAEIKEWLRMAGGDATDDNAARIARGSSGRHGHTLECGDCLRLAQTAARLNEAALVEAIEGIQKHYAPEDSGGEEAWIEWADLHAVLNEYAVLSPDAPDCALRVRTPDGGWTKGCAPRLTPDREHRPEALDGVPTGWCECGRPYPHTGEEPDRG